VDTGFRKRSCSDNKLDRDDDSKKSHPDPVNPAACRARACVYRHRQRIGVMPGKKLNPEKAEAELIKIRKIVRTEKQKAKKLKGNKLERSNMKLTIKTLSAGVEAVEGLRDAAEELEVKNAAP
jgi:hypothetical protein